MPPVIPTTRLNSDAMIECHDESKHGIADREDDDGPRAEDHAAEGALAGVIREHAAACREEGDERAEDKSEDQVEHPGNLRARQRLPHV